MAGGGVAARLDDRARNRALLARQGLLTRTEGPALAMVERLVGMQAQEPENPYVALWSRLEGLRPQDLSALLAERRAVRSGLMRSTIHLVSARDCLALGPLTQPLRARTFRSPFAPGLREAPLEQVVAAGAALIAERPRTRAELATALGPRWPDADPAALSAAVTFHLTLVQVPPRGLWDGRGQARWALAEQWLDAPLEREPRIEPFVLRYLAAFGPATVSDVRTWCGLTGLRAVVERLRPRLRTFRDERGRELLDVPDAPLPDRDTPAPPRFLPEYDNVLLSHADRAHVVGDRGPGAPFPRGRWIGTLLVDGFYRANWSYAGGRLTIDRFAPARDDPAGVVDEIAGEGERLARFIAPEVGADVVFLDD